jgi:RNA polymerase sigma-70 factor (ECF subfamily)
MTDEADAVRRLTALYDAHHRQVHAYAMRRGDRQVADEIVTDTFMVAWRRMADIPHSPLPWLLGVARNLIQENFRRSARQASVEDEFRAWVATDEPVASDPADVVADRDGVLTALAQLDEEDRELLTLIAWHGLSTAEAAEVIGCTTGTCAVRLHRARRRLDQAMKSTVDVHRPRRLSPEKTYLKGVV